jgi:amino acid transporter
MTTLDLVLGRPLSSAEDKDERVGSFAGVSVFGLDALSSAAYGPEAALTILIPLGVAGLRFSLPMTIAVSSILAIVYFSYRQTISAYPNGAGTYTVAKENLGRRVGLLGAVALLIDYTLNVAVGISILRNELLLKGENRILIVNVPWQIEKHPETGKRRSPQESRKR